MAGDFFAIAGALFITEATVEVEVVVGAVVTVVVARIEASFGAVRITGGDFAGCGALVAVACFDSLIASEATCDGVKLLRTFTIGSIAGAALLLDIVALAD